MVKNLKSADEFPLVVDQKISKELQLGRIMGPYDEPPHVQNYKISPLGVVPKKTPGKFRIIHHLSYPEGSSVNDFYSQGDFLSAVRNGSGCHQHNYANSSASLHGESGY